MKEPKIDNHFGDPEVQEYIDFIVREALFKRDEEWKKEIKGLMRVSKTEWQALDDLINSMK